MRPLALPALVIALCLAPAADACFLKKCSRPSRAGGVVTVPATVTIVSIDGQAPVWDPVDQRWEIPNPIRSGVPVPMVVRTNFDPGSENYVVTGGCPDYAAKPVVVSAKPAGAGFTDVDKTIDIGPYNAGASCFVSVSVTGISSETVHFTVAAR